MYRNKKLLEYARKLPCQHCGIDDGTIVAAHSNQLRDGKGRGLKASDYRIASLCYTCHSEIDQGKRLNKADRVQMFEDAHRSTIGQFFELGFITVS
jgi:CRISPR/Cas system-associated protein Cas10 (large subunit of type III CRISPR-Cas system)